jgi:hypothetical protein
MKRKLAIAIALLLTFGLMPVGTGAAPSQVRVSLPRFDVTLNGMQVNNEYRQYPLIVYKDITYFPMTYYDCRFLGVETTWDADSGLGIEKTGITGAYRDYAGKAKNGNSYTAAIPAFDVTINGKRIDNTAEEYPLLLFRDVTYFPMTWRFCVDELGWEYHFDPSIGLVIQSSNKRLEKSMLPGYKDGHVIVNDGYIYYGGADGVIYQAKASNPAEARDIYQLPKWTYIGDTFVNYGLSKTNGEAWLNYHQGGASMGTDYFIRLNPNGSTEVVERGYLAFKTFGDITVKVDQWSPPERNNLMIKEKAGDYKRVGNPDYLYGYDYELRGDGSMGGSPSKDIYMRDNFVYVLAVDRTKETDGSRIYSVNIDTNETELVSDLRVNSFKMEGDYIYCISEGRLYEISLDLGAEKTIDTFGTVTREIDFQVFGGTVYYVSIDDGRLYAVGADQSINPNGRVSGLKTDEGYLICTFQEESGNPYRIMVLDSDGRVAFKSSDVAQITGISIDNGRLYYAESTLGAFCASPL